jgi:hypothetical protein
MEEQEVIFMLKHSPCQIESLSKAAVGYPSKLAAV